MIRILVVGAGVLGAKVIKQLQLNKKIKIITSDTRENPYCLKEKIVKKIDVTEHLSPMNVKEIIKKVKPDLIILARRTEDWGHEETTMGTQFVIGMEREISKIGGVPIIPASRSLEF